MTDPISVSASNVGPTRQSQICTLTDKTSCPASLEDSLEDRARERIE